MNSTKFGSPHLDTPSSRYNFCKFAFKSVKINQEKHFKYRSIAGTHGSMGPTRQQHTEQGRGLTGEKLTDGEVTGGSVTTDVFPNSIRIDRYPRLAQRLTRASSTVTMVARLQRAVVPRPSLAMTSSGEHDYGSRVT